MHLRTDVALKLLLNVVPSGEFVSTATGIETEMKAELADKVPAQQGSCRVCLLQTASAAVPGERPSVCRSECRHLGLSTELGSGK